jgi:leucyl/phenylalanyl-tRNA--protein transferase
MPLYRFPDLLGIPPQDTPEGLVALGGDLSVENVMEAYRKGIFPWPMSPGREEEALEHEFPLTWFSPSPRAIFDFNRIHIPRSLKKARLRAPYRFTVDQCFTQVIDRCSQVPRPGQAGTWITDPMRIAYQELHARGHAHSVEAWTSEKGQSETVDSPRLVGGIYGVDIDGAFAGESMFHLEPDASKLALLFLADFLVSKGLDWMDIQMLTPHLTSLGAYEITRDEYLVKLAATRARRLRLF